MHVVTHRFSFSQLHKDGEVSQMIAAAHNFVIRFVDQRTSSARPGAVELTPTEVKEVGQLLS